MSRRSPWSWRCNQPPTCLSIGHCPTPVKVVTFWLSYLRRKISLDFPKHPLVFWHPCYLFLGWKILVCQPWCCIISSFNIALVPMSEMALVYLVWPRCKFLLLSFFVGSELPIPLSMLLLFEENNTSTLCLFSLSAVKVSSNPRTLIPCKKICVKAYAEGTEYTVGYSKVY